MQTRTSQTQSYLAKQRIKWHDDRLAESRKTTPATVFVVWVTPPGKTALDESPCGPFADRKTADAFCRFAEKGGCTARIMVDDTTRPDFAAAVRV